MEENMILHCRHTLTRLTIDEDLNEEIEARVHIIVRNGVPPFLDGRFTMKSNIAKLFMD